MVSQQPGPRLPELLFLSVIANLSKLAFSTTIGKKDQLKENIEIDYLCKYTTYNLLST